MLENLKSTTKPIAIAVAAATGAAADSVNKYKEKKQSNKTAYGMVFNKILNQH